MEDQVIGHTHQDQSIDREIAISRIHRTDLDTQVCVIVAIIGRLYQRASNQQIVITIIVEGNMKGIEFGDRHLIPHTTQAKAGQQNKRKWMEWK